MAQTPARWINYRPGQEIDMARLKRMFGEKNAPQAEHRVGNAWVAAPLAGIGMAAAGNGPVQLSKILDLFNILRHQVRGVMETATILNMTRQEAQLVAWMGQGLEANRLNRQTPTFTCQGLAAAIDGLPGVTCRPNQRDLGGILTRMGVTMVIRNYRRNTEQLAAVLPEWKAKVKRVLSREREREIVFPGLTSHSNITR